MLFTAVTEGRNVTARTWPIVTIHFAAEIIPDSCPLNQLCKK